MHYCPNCKRSFNDEEKLFCPKCGTPLVEKTVCQYCYAANLPDHAFCVKCGKLLTKPENDGEEKIAKNVLVTPELQQGQNLVDQSLAFAQESRERQQFSKCKDKGTSKLERDENTDVLQGTTVTYQKKNGSSNRDNKTTNHTISVF